MPPEGVVLVSIAVVLVSGALLLPIVRSLAERIRGRPVAAGADDIQALRDDVMQELQQVRHEVAELGERVDFTERLLAKGAKETR